MTILICIKSSGTGYYVCPNSNLAEPHTCHGGRRHGGNCGLCSGSGKVLCGSCGGTGKSSG
eukprot:4173-Heterococcus_DN1.PRE.4